MLYRPVFLLPALLMGVLASSSVFANPAHESHATPDADAKRIAPLLAVNSKLPPPPPGVTDIKFREFFKMPIGPQGLEPTEKLISLNGKQVRIVGYMVNAEEPPAGPFVLAPLAVSMAEKEDGPADDVPATTVYVHVANGENWVVPYVPGLLKLTGTLSLGGKEEPDGRVSSVRLMLSPEFSKKLLPKQKASANGHAAKK
jgi:hypothetical protein